MFQKMIASDGEGGGSKGVNIGKAPDAIYTNANMSSGATATLSVTQKPRLLIFEFCSSSSSSSDLGIDIYNVETEDAWRYGYWSNAWQNGAWTNVTDYFTSITSSSVGIKNSYGGSARVQVAAYY